jgi:hypothetical protein
MFQRLQLWKNERIGSFYSFVMSRRPLEGIPQGRPQHDVLVRRGLVLLCFFSDSFFHRGPETANKYPSLTSM